MFGDENEVIARKLEFSIKYFFKRGISFTKCKVDEQYAKEYFSSLFNLVNEIKGKKEYEKAIWDFYDFLIKYEFQKEEDLQTRININTEIIMEEFYKCLDNAQED